MLESTDDSVVRDWCRCLADLQSSSSSPPPPGNSWQQTS